MGTRGLVFRERGLREQVCVEHCEVTAQLWELSEGRAASNRTEGCFSGSSSETRAVQAAESQGRGAGCGGTGGLGPGVSPGEPGSQVTHA